MWRMMAGKGSKGPLSKLSTRGSSSSLLRNTPFLKNTPLLKNTGQQLRSMSSKADWPESPAKLLPAPKKPWGDEFGPSKSLPLQAPELEKESDAPAETPELDELLTPEVLEGRASYEAEITGLRDELDERRTNGDEPEAIARALHAKRRAIGEKYKHLTPPDLLEKIYARNIEKHGDKWGPTIEVLKAKGYDWDTIADKACTPGGKDLFGDRAKK